MSDQSDEGRLGFATAHGQRAEETDTHERNRGRLRHTDNTEVIEVPVACGVLIEVISLCDRTGRGPAIREQGWPSAEGCDDNRVRASEALCNRRGDSRMQTAEADANGCVCDSAVVLEHHVV